MIRILRKLLKKIIWELEELDGGYTKPTADTPTFEEYLNMKYKEPFHNMTVYQVKRGYKFHSYTHALTRYKKRYNIAEYVVHEEIG